MSVHPAIKAFDHDATRERSKAQLKGLIAGMVAEGLPIQDICHSMASILCEQGQHEWVETGDKSLLYTLLKGFVHVLDDLEEAEPKVAALVEQKKARLLGKAN